MNYLNYRTGAPVADTKAPEGPVAERWDRRRFEAKLVNPANRRKHTVIVVGTGLAGGAAGATLAEQGYHVVQFCYQDSPRRAHSIAAQGGINAAKNYRNDGDSIHRLFYDTVKGGDFRARESNVHRLAQISVEIIDQCVAQGVPFAREYGGLLDTRSFGGVQVSRTFYARGQTGQQLLLGAYQALSRQIAADTVEMHARTEMLDLIVVGGRARGIVARDLITGEVSSHFADAVVLASGGYGNVFYLSTNAMNSNATAIWRAHRRGAYFANPCFTQIHPTCIPRTGEHQSKLTLMSESLRNDGRIWVPRAHGDERPPNEIPEDERDYYLERIYPSFGNLVPRDIASRAAKNVCDEGRGVGPGGQGVYLDFADAIRRMGRDRVAERYGNLFDMYERITAENPYEVPMRIYPAVHYTMGGLWVDYDLQTTVPGLFAVGEANFSDHGANRLGASALMQGLADGYFVLPSTINDYLARNPHPETVDASHPAVAEVLAETEDRLNLLLAVNGDRTPDSFHRELGQLMWEFCGMARTDEGLRKALERIPQIREEFWRRIKVPGRGEEFNQSLEKANRIVDYLELAELMCLDALHRAESCGGHFREESQTPDGEAARRDEEFGYVAAWEYGAAGGGPREAAGPASRPSCTRKTSSSSTSTPLSGATHEAHPARLAPAERRRHRRHGHVRGRRHLKGHVVPRDARHPQRGAHPQGRRAGRLRPRLPRGHLRRLQPGHQRRRPRSGAHHHVPAPYAVLQGRRHHRRRAMAGLRLPGGEGPGRGPLGLRPDHPGRRLHQRPDRLRARGPRHAGSETGCRLRLRARGVHRLRRLRRRLSQRLGDALHLGEDQPPQCAAAGRARARDPGARHGRGDGRGGLRRLHADRRMCDGVPEGDPAAVDRGDEQGVAAGDPESSSLRPPLRPGREIQDSFPV